MFESPSIQLMNQHMREGCHSRQAKASFCVEVLSRQFGALSKSSYPLRSAREA